VSALGVLLVFTAVHVAVIVLRLRAPAPPPPFRIPLSVRGIPVGPLLGVAVNGLLITQFTAKVYVWGVACRWPGSCSTSYCAGHA
jgi:amino acid transporter